MHLFTEGDHHKNHNCSEHGEQPIMECWAPTDTSAMQPQHLSLREHYGRGVWRDYKAEDLEDCCEIASTKNGREAPPTLQQ